MNQVFPRWFTISAFLAGSGLFGACGDSKDSPPDARAGEPLDAFAPDAPSTRALQIESVEDLGAMPLPSAVTNSRDGGQSGLLGGKSLWTFGDTFTTSPVPIDNTSIMSATGGWSSPATPFMLEQPVDANGFPSQLIPYTADEIAANQADYHHGWAVWPGSLLDVGAQERRLTFLRVRRTGGNTYETKGVGTARITVDARVASRDAADLFAPPEPLFQPLQVLNGYVYAFSCNLHDLAHKLGCKLARAPQAVADQRAAYQFFDGTSWVSDVATAVVVFDRVGGAPTISWNPYLGRYLSVSGLWVVSTVLLRTADRIEGPWGEPVEIFAGDTGVIAPAPGSYNYIIVGHPELDSADGRSIVISYSRPTGILHRDVRLARITLR